MVIPGLPSSMGTPTSGAADDVASTRAPLVVAARGRAQSMRVQHACRILSVRWEPRGGGERLSAVAIGRVALRRRHEAGTVGGGRIAGPGGRCLGGRRGGPVPAR